MKVQQRNGKWSSWKCAKLNGITEKITVRENVDTAAVGESLDIQPEELSEG